MFYGWIILGTLSVCYFLIIGATFYGFGVVLAPMTADLGWSRAEAGTGFSLLVLTSGLGGPLIAVMIRRFGARVTMSVGALFLAAGAWITATTTSLLAFYLGAGVLMGLGMAMQTVLPGTHLLNHWFMKRRSLAIGVFFTAGGIGAFVAAPTFNAIIEATGSWRLIWLIIGGAGLLAGLFSALFIRERPELLGQHADGAATSHSLIEEQGSTPGPARVYQTPIDWDLRPALATSAFWLILFGVTLSVLGLHVVNSQTVLHLTDIGVSAALAATALGVQGLVSTAGRLFAGVLGDRIEPRLLLAAGLACEMVALAVLATATSTWQVYVFAVFFGTGWGLAYVAAPSLIANYFGRRNYAALFATMGLAVTTVGALGPVAAGAVSDLSGSYAGAFYTYSAVAALAVLAMLLLRPPRPRQD